MKHLDLFSGIGGFALASEKVWPKIEHTFCEIDPFCQTILSKHWPTSKIYDDIKQLSSNTRSQEQRGVSDSSRETLSTLRGCDLLTGGFPCQPFSQAGKRKGTGDDRHLWPEMRRVIQEFSPAWVVGENVRGLLSIDGGLVFEQVCLDLEALGYEVQPFVIPACAVGAPHRRDRVWIVAHRKDLVSQRNVRKRGGNAESKTSSGNRNSIASDHECLRLEGREQSEYEQCRQNDWQEPWPQAATRLCSLDDGLPNGLVRPRGWRNAALKAAGNAIVPQVAEQIFRAIKEYENSQT